ncbi:MAG TPA: beta-N-acetylglucosaminidase domain-containing protein [Tepidisphaeraceae bacterium]|jgi:hyaluronoglucosaminidase
MKKLIVLGACAVMLLASALRAETSPFKIRGIKGLWWEGMENYRLALPWAAQHNMNFLMFCYTSFPASGKDWRAAYSDDELRDFAELAKQSEKLKVNLCLSFNPGIWSKPPLVYSNEEDFEIALKKVQAVHARGINWFALCLDDIGRKLEPADEQQFQTLQKAQGQFVNRLWGVMKNMQPKPVLIFCPSAYTTQDAEKHQDYIKTVGEEIDREVMMFWTGPLVCSPTITASDAKKFGGWIRRKPVVWDNYPVNDMFPWRPLVAPVKGRSSDLANEVEGVMANPMKQWQASKLPLATLASYLNDPAHYKASNAMEAAIAEYPADDREALSALINVYGTAFLGERSYPPQPGKVTGNAGKFQQARYEKLKTALGENKNLAPLWADIQPTLDEDLRKIRKWTRDRKTESPLVADGDDFAGGAGDVHGFSRYGKDVNYVYAQATKRSEMHATFYAPADYNGAAKLVVSGRDDDSGKKLKIRIAVNEKVVFAGESPFESKDFVTKTFEVKGDVIEGGENVVSIRNLEAKGTMGSPPWFMVSEVKMELEERK